MRRLIITIGLLLLFARFVQAQTCTVTTVDLERATVQTALDAANDGDVVCLPFGSATWTTRVDVPVGLEVTIKGAGIGATILTNHTTTGELFRVQPTTWVLTTSPQVRITGLTCDMDGHGVGEIGCIETIGNNVVGTAYNAVRYDHLFIDRISGRGISFHLNRALLSGLVDHVTFHCDGSGNCQSVIINGGNNFTSSAGMTRSYETGSDKAIYVEDVTMNYDAQQDGGVEGYGGAWYVLRRSQLHGVKQGSHGADSGNYRGAQLIEMYQNTFDMSTRAGATSVFGLYRSGVGFEWGNTWSTDYNNGTHNFRNYRSNNTPQNRNNWGWCTADDPNGPYAWDGNTGTGNESRGYPCLDQAGWFFDNVFNPAVRGWYGWWNRRGGTAPDFSSIWPPAVGGTIDNRVAESSNNTQFDIVANREYWNENTSYNGTTQLGVGVGAIAARPASCAIGDGYWATDEGEWDNTHTGADGRFYRCSSANTWTLTYTPYTYPHPLRNEATTAPAAPTSLSATASGQSTIDLSWTDNSSDETSFLIERGLTSDCSDCQQIGSVSANVTSFPDTGLTPSTTYYYRVRASNTAGQSAYTSIASDTTDSPASPITHPNSNDCTAAATLASGTTQTCTVSGAVAGQTLIWSSTWKGSGVTATATDNGVAVTAAIARTDTTSTNAHVRTWIAKNVTAGDHIIVITYSASATWRSLHAAAFSGLGTGPTVTDTSSGASSGTSPSGGSVTNTAADALIWHAAVNNLTSGAAMTTGTYTLAGTADVSSATAYKVVSSIVSQSDAFTQASSDEWAAQTLAIEIGTDTGGTTPPKNTYFVDITNGNDTAGTTGESDDPFQTIGYALTRMVGCDTLRVLAGNYSGTFTITEALSGSPDDSGCQTRFLFDPGVFITGSGINSGRISIGFNNGNNSNTPANYIYFQGGDISNMNQGIEIFGGHDIVVTGVTVHDVGQEGIHSRGNESEGNSGFNLSFIDNTIYNTGLNGSNGEGLYVGSSSLGAQDNSHDIVIRGNIIHNTTDEGINLKPGTHDIVVENNTIYNNGTDHVGCTGNWAAAGSGIDVEERDLPPQTWTGNPNHIIRGNVIHDPTCGALGLGTGTTVYNNIIYNVPNGLGGIIVNNNDGDSFSRIVYHNTIAISTVTDAIVQNDAPVVDIQNNIGPSTGNNLAYNAAFFINPAGADFRLKKGATPVNAGANLTAIVPVDITNRQRDGAPDVGAYEYGTTFKRRIRWW